MGPCPPQACGRQVWALLMKRDQGASGVSGGEVVREVEGGEAAPHWASGQGPGRTPTPHAHGTQARGYPAPSLWTFPPGRSLPTSLPGRWVSRRQPLTLIGGHGPWPGPALALGATFSKLSLGPEQTLHLSSLPPPPQPVTAAWDVSSSLWPPHVKPPRPVCRPQADRDLPHGAAEGGGGEPRGGDRHAD